MLTISDLAARWQVSTAEAIRICRERGVPFVRLRRAKEGKQNVQWKAARFRPEAIEKWEAAQQETHPNSKAKAQPQPAPDLPGQRRLGKWH